MKRLLIVTTVPVTLRAFLLPYAQYFRALGWQIDAMASGISNCQACPQNFDRVWEISWSRNPLNLFNLMRAPSQIRQAVRQGAYDIVHVHTPVAAFVTRFALRNLRAEGCVRVIYTAHGFHFYKGGEKLKNVIFLALEKLAGRWTDRLVVINQEDFEAAQTHRLVPAERITYMPGIGVDTKLSDVSVIQSDAHAQVCKDLDLAPDTRIFFMAAEFIPRKRHADVLQAFARLSDQKSCLLFAGTGPLEPEMKTLATSLGVAERTRFLGFRQDVPDLVRSSIATILPSSQEGLPRCVMESLCLGVPVIGSAIRGTQDLLKDGCGILVPVGDITAITQSMAWVLEHPERAQAMGEKGRSRMVDFDLQHVLKMHESMYNEAFEDSEIAHERFKINR